MVSSKKKVAVLVSFSFLSTDEIVRCSTFDSFPGFYIVLRNSLKSYSALNLMWVCSCACVRLCVRLCVGEIFRNTLSESIWKKIFIILGYLKMSEEKNYASRACFKYLFLQDNHQFISFMFLRRYVFSEPIFPVFQCLEVLLKILSNKIRQ